MRSGFRHTGILMMFCMLVMDDTVGHSQGAAVSWLDEATIAPWNTPGQTVPAAPRIQDSVNPRCRELARPPQVEEDNTVRDRGWDLVGAFQGGWNVLVVRGTASYDGMCRPIQYLDFVFVRGIFAGTLAPKPMDSRTDGALGRVSLQSAARLTAEYSRYEKSDPLCCPSRTTRVTFDIAQDPPVVRAGSASSSQNIRSKRMPRSSPAAPPGGRDGIAAVRIERQDDVWLHVRNHPANRVLDLEHVDIRQRPRIVAPVSFAPRRVVKAEEYRRVDAKSLAGEPEFLGAKRTESINRSNRRVRLAGLAVGGAHQGDANASCAEMRQNAAVKDLVIGMCQDDEQRRTT